MKKFIYIALLIAPTLALQAQQYPLFSNYVTNAFGYNPAMAGVNEHIDMRFMYRTQWVQLEDAPQTMIASVTGRAGKSPFGVGGYFYNDKAGAMYRTGGAGMFSYTQNLAPKTFLTLGIAGGFYNFRLSDQFLASAGNDPTLANAQAGVNLPDFNAGLYFRSSGFYAGFSIPQVFERNVDYTELTKKSTLHRHYYGLLGYQFDLNDRIVIEPSSLLKYTESAQLQYDLSVRAIFNKNFWLGGGYRNRDAAIVMAGFDTKFMSISYAFDVTTSALNNVSSGSHEITLGMKFGHAADRDKDGIPDKEDKCPDVPGTKENEGCPPNDKDKDGIIDPDDKCPDVPGVKENEGCPEDDKDQDGIRDAEDKCPDKPGTKEKQGCPDDEKDTDGDGVPDVRDQCPNQAGLKENSGCPFGDKDGDGLRDDIDKCPTIPGVVKNLGCPIDDRDQDGVVDSSDPCPDEPGPIPNFGCPPGRGPNALTSSSNGDRDMDGVPDHLDKCPNTAGPKENSGCPIISRQEKELLDATIRNVYFDYNRAELRSESFKYLNDLAKYMREHPSHNIHMEGHTDSRGSEEYNMELSKNRVYAVMYYLQDRGIDANRIRVEYFGESRPVAENLVEQDRQKNRRVEMRFEFD
jgi:type IX secretion system PorP/SprF family membrane protein